MGHGRSRLVHMRLALTFLALGSVASFFLGHEIGGGPALAAAYARAAVALPLVTLQASGALGVKLPVSILPGNGRRAHRAAGPKTAKDGRKAGEQSSQDGACPPGSSRAGAPLALPPSSSKAGAPPAHLLSANPGANPGAAITSSCSAAGPPDAAITGTPILAATPLSPDAPGDGQPVPTSPPDMATAGVGGAGQAAPPAVVTDAAATPPAPSGATTPAQG